jgi:type I restriction enzyme S subunit
MAGEWREVTIGDLVWLHDQQITPASAPAELFYHYSIPAYDSGQRPALETGSAIGSNKFVVPRGAVLVSKLNPRLPRVWAPDIPDKARAVASTEFLVLSPRDGVDRRFLKYLMLSPAVRSAMEARVTGTSGSHQRVRPSDLLSISVDIPVDLQEQRAIAHILGTLDDKIELNRRMSQTLEAMARALFKSWFVDFEPVRAKMEGRWQRGQSLPGLPAHLYDLFPDRLVESELGEIPEGWRVARLGDFVVTIKGRSYKSEELVEGSDVALVTLKSFARGGGYRPDGLKPFAGCYKQEQVVEPGEVVVACTDVTQAAEVIGRAAMVRRSNLYRDLVASLDTLIVRPKTSDMTVAFLYSLLRTDAFVEHTYAHVTGTTVLHLAKDAVASFTFALPPEMLVHIFDGIAGIIFSKVETLELENDTLAALRDALLPKLIRGEIRVKDAERFLKERISC